MTADLLGAALAYAAHGWPVLPLVGKRPNLPDWPNAASTDPDVIRGWWAARPDSNVGIVTGRRSGLAVLDVDPRSGGTDSLARLEERVGVLPGTVLSLTGGGGLHMLYAHPGVKVTSAAHSLGRGLDVKGDGGQIVAPPSIHPETGRAYAWHGDVWDVELTPWPSVLAPMPVAPSVRPAEALSALVRADPGRRLAGLVQVVLDASEGERNSRLFWSACRGAELVGAGLGRDVVGDALLLAAEAVGLDPPSAQATVRSGLHSGRVAA